jgi:hypothetical protein
LYCDGTSVMSREVELDIIDDVSLRGYLYHPRAGNDLVMARRLRTAEGMKAVDEGKRGKHLRAPGGLVFRSPSPMEALGATQDLCLLQCAWGSSIHGQAE